MFASLKFFTLISLLTRVSHGALLTDPASVNGTTYDYIVIGAGIGGSVIAGRLSENPKLRILLVEAGISGNDILNVTVPFLATFASPNTVINWNYTSIPQPALDNRVISVVQGRMLGGSSGVNYMVYTRGSSDNYDQMAKVTGDPSWSFKNILPYIKKHEKWTPPRAGYDTEGKFDPRYHGFKGKIKVTLENYPSAINDRILQTVGTVPGFDYVKDMNSGNPLGFGWTQSTTGGGARSSAAEYLTGQPNLDILIQTTATRLVQNGKKKGVPYFNTVEVASDSSSPRYTVKAKREIIVSTGGVGTPKLLMLSGIGPKSALANLGISVVVDSKDVGQGLQDHPVLNYAFEVNGTFTYEDIFPHIPSFLPEWQEKRTGPLTNGPVGFVGWVRLPENDTYLQSHPDPAPGLNTPHIEYIISNGILVGLPITKPHYMGITTTVASPTSRGSVTLNSTDPFADPIVDPAYLTSEADIHIITESYKGIQRLLSAPAWKDYVVGPHELAAGYDFNNSSEVTRYARAFVRSQKHPTCTASMSRDSSPNGVVNHKLCVKGATGLRVVDGSVFPRLPAAHPQAVIYAVAEKAADMVKVESC